MLVKVDSQRILAKNVFFHLYLAFTNSYFYAMIDKSKTTLVCGTANCIRSRLFVGNHITLERDKSPNKQTLSDTISCATHKCSFPILERQDLILVIYYHTTITGKEGGGINVLLETKVGVRNFVRAFKRGPQHLCMHFLNSAPPFPINNESSLMPSSHLHDNGQD